MPQTSVFEGNAMLDAFCLYEELEFDFMPMEPMTSREMFSNQEGGDLKNVLSEDSLI